MLRVGSVVVGVSDVHRAAAFWCQALDYVPRDGVVEDTRVVLAPRERGGPNISLGLSETPPQEFPRIHLDLYADSAEEQAAEAARLVGLGAKHVDWPHYNDESDFIVLADTEDNIFCVINKGA